MSVAALGFSQRTGTVLKYKMAQDTVYGAADTDYCIFPNIAGEYDVSIQLVPSLYGVGDSIYFSHIAYLSDSYTANAWTSVSTADTITSATDADNILYWSDMKPVRVKIIYTGIGDDTVLVQPYAVYKKHANE